VGKMNLSKLFGLMLLIFSGSSLYAQNIQVVKAAEIISRINTASDTTFILNFWATWCAPCVKELPYFEVLNETLSGQPFKILLVSLDFKKDVSTRLQNFMEKRQMKCEVLFLDERDANEWIPLFSNSWSGVIPATNVIHRGKNINEFRASAFEQGELERWLREMGALE
jgi:thiol-disulfide isomerase/thioredoxin